MKEETDSEDGNVLTTAASGLHTARNQGLVSSVKQSISGWRRIGGMTVGFATFLDLIFIAIGAAFILNFNGYGFLAGAFFATIGVIGILEKVLRRVIG